MIRRAWHAGCEAARIGRDASCVANALEHHIFCHIAFCVSEGSSVSQLGGHMFHWDAERAPSAEA